MPSVGSGLQRRWQQAELGAEVLTNPLSVGPDNTGPNLRALVSPVRSNPMRDRYLELLRIKIQTAYLKLHTANMSDDVNALLYQVELDEATRALEIGEAL